MELKKGDKISVIDDLIEGIVVAINGDEIQVETNDGFILQFFKHEVIKINADLSTDFNKPIPEALIKEKLSSKKPKKPTPSKKERKAPAMEVDLHIHHLVKTTRGMDNYDMLNLQIATAQRQLEFALQKKIQRVVFIHGVGEGVLKAELEALFRRYDNLQYYDADYQKYGRGATEIYIFQNTT